MLDMGDQSSIAQLTTKCSLKHKFSVFVILTVVNVFSGTVYQLLVKKPEQEKVKMKQDL